MNWIIVVDMAYYPYVHGTYPDYEEAKKEYDKIEAEERVDTYLAEVKEQK